MAKYFIMITSYLLVISTAQAAKTHCEKNLPETSESEIAKIINECAPVHPSSIRQGQYVQIEETQSLDQQLPMAISQRLDKITKRVETPDSIDLDFSVTLNEMDNHGSWKQSQQEHFVQINKMTSLQSFLPILTQRKNPQVRYVNFKSETGVMPVPSLVQQKPNCGGVSDCSNGLRVLKIQFDRIATLDQNNFEKASFQLVFSPDVPAYVADWTQENLQLTNLIRACGLSSLTADNNGNEVVASVHRCKDLKNFEFGLYKNSLR